MLILYKFLSPVSQTVDSPIRQTNVNLFLQHIKFIHMTNAVIECDVQRNLLLEVQVLFFTPPVAFVKMIHSSRLSSSQENTEGSPTSIFQKVHEYLPLFPTRILHAGKDFSISLFQQNIYTFAFVSQVRIIFFQFRLK